MACNFSNRIPLSEPEIAGNAWHYVKTCLDTGWVSSAGQFVDQFEQFVANYAGRKHAVALVNGTAALHLALMVAGIRPGDEVIVSTLTFIAPVNAICYIGAHPVLIDAEARHGQMDISLLRDFLVNQCRRIGKNLCNKKTGRRIGALLPVHILGHAVDMDALIDLVREFDLPLIEDASEGLGVAYKGRKLGSLGDISCLSFNGNKIITTGGGGMLLTDNDTWAARARYLSTQAKDDPDEYIHGEIGYNYRLTNLQAALGCAQMENLNAFIEAKRAIAHRYNAEIASIDGVTPFCEPADCFSTFWLYTIQIDETKTGVSSRQLLKYLMRIGIQSRPIWQPMHQAPPHKNCLALLSGVADRIYLQALSLPSSSGLMPDAQQRVIDGLKNGLKNPDSH